MGRRIVDALAVGAVVALYFAVILPVQSYMPNADEFGYSMSSLLAEFGWYCVALGLLISLVLFLSSFLLDRFLHVLALSLLCAAVLEAGPLAIGLPKLDGDLRGYGVTWRMVVDTCVLSVVVVMPLVFLRRVRTWLPWISAALVLYLGATLFDVRRGGISSEGRKYIVPRLYPRHEVVDTSVFSPSNNVIVLVLDSVSVDVAEEVFANDRNLRARFPGFVNFVNNVGMHQATHVALPGLMTGKYFESSSDLQEYVHSMWTRDSFLGRYLESGNASFVNVDFRIGGYTSFPRDGKSAVETPAAKPSTVRMDDGAFMMTVVELSLFRIVPYAIKVPYVRYAASQTCDRGARPQRESPSGNVPIPNSIIAQDKQLWPMLAKRPVDPHLAKTLHVHHSRGCHPPIFFDADGKSIKCSSPVTYDEYMGQCRYVFRLVGDMLDVWRTNGVYDASTIIMLADHSTSVVCPHANRSGWPRPSYPFLMVKARGGAGSYVESRIPTSHARVAPLVRNLALQDMDQEEIARSLFEDKRLYREFGEGVINDWCISAGGEIVKSSRPDAEVDVAGLHPLTVPGKYSFMVMGVDFKTPEVVVRNGKRGTPSGLQFMRNPMSFAFRVPERNASYRLTVKSYMSAQDGKPYSVTMRSGKTIRRIESKPRPQEMASFALDPVISDDDGLVKVEVACDSKLYVTIKCIELDRSMLRQRPQDFRPIETNVCLTAKKANYNFITLAGPADLANGKRYRFEVRDIEVLQGRPQGAQVVLHNHDTHQMRMQMIFKGGDKRFDGGAFEFVVPDSGCWHLLLYAGLKGETEGVSVLYRDVSLKQAR